MSIIIKEFDKTSTGINSGYSNFSIVIPGYVYNTNAYSEVADENGVYECTRQEDFKNNVGFGLYKPGSTAEGKHLGNEIAYLLLGLGYTVLYVKIESLYDLKKASTFEALKDKSAYDFRYIINGLWETKSEDTKTANTIITQLASYSNKNIDTNRGDCCAYVEIAHNTFSDKTTQSAIISAIQAEAKEVVDWDAEEVFGKYTAISANPITYDLSSDSNIENSYDSNEEFPAYMHYFVCNARSLKNFAEWYAVSGETRGVGDFVVKSVSKKLGEIAIRTLQARASSAKDAKDRSVNIVVKVKDNYYFWGNRTAHVLGNPGTTEGDLVASHFLNIRQLCTTIKKQLYVTCRRYTFDPNTDTLWFNFTSEITPLLERMKADQGIRNYKLYQVKSARKAKINAVLRIVPVEAVEDFEINMYLEDSVDGNLDVSFDE